MKQGTLFVHLKFTAFNNFACGIPELVDIYTPEKIGEIYDILLVSQIEFIYFFAQEIKQLDRIVLIVFFCKIFEGNNRGRGVWIEMNGGWICVIRKANRAVLGPSTGHRKEHHKENKVKNPHSYWIRFQGYNIPKFCQKYKNCRNRLCFLYLT